MANVTPINENEKWIGIKLIDLNKSNSNNLELQVDLKYEQIKKIATHISTEYQKEILDI